MYRATHSTIHPLLFLGLFSLVLLFSQGTQATASETQPDKKLAVATVRTQEVIEQEVPSLVEVVGTLQATQRAAIAAKVTGVITDIPVLLGSKVNQGDLLVTISAEEISAQVNQAEAQLAQAKRNLDREKKLLKKKASTSETVRSMQEMYALAQAGYREAKTMLGYATITAPFSGVVTRKNGNAGDLATPGTPLLLLENNEHLQVVTAVPETLVLHIKSGDTLAVSIPAAELQTKGTVAEIAPSADPSSRTAPVKINLEPNNKLRTGQFARVILPGTSTSSIFVPQAAVLSRGQMEKVFVAAEGKAHLRLVRTGFHRDGMIEVLSGLTPGEQVIIENNQLLVNGQPLQITP